MGMPLEERLGTDIRRVHQELIAAKHSVLKAVGLTVPQYSALYLIDRSPGISGAALARETLVTPQTIASVLHNLQTRGLIERQPHKWHRNAVETRLTTAGKRALAAADEAASAIERRLANRLTADDRGTLRALLRECSNELHTIASELAEERRSTRSR